jgi:hypothetical protein
MNIHHYKAGTSRKTSNNEKKLQLFPESTSDGMPARADSQSTESNTK